MVVGDIAWFAKAFFDPNVSADGILGVFMVPASERAKPKRPTELAVALLEKVTNLPNTSKEELQAILSIPTVFTDFTNKMQLSPSFASHIVGLGGPIFFLEVAAHILGDDIETFQDQYNTIRRSYYEDYIQYAARRTPGTATTPEDVINERRASDVALAMLMYAQELASEMAKDYLVRIGYHGDNQLIGSTLRAAFDALHKTWQARALAFASQLMKPGELMRLIKEAEPYLDRVTVYRRGNEMLPRMNVVYAKDGEAITWEIKFRDRSPYVPIRDYLAAGYLNMAYQISGTSIMPVVESDDINSLLLDLTVPEQEQTVETVVDADDLMNIVLANRGMIYRTDHVSRYLLPEGFLGGTEMAGFALDIPKGANRDIFSIVDVALPVGTTTAETLSILEHPEVYSGCVMTIFGKKYPINGLGAREYALHYAAQVFGALVPYTTDTGKVTVVASDKLRAPTKIAELPKFVGEGVVHFLDKTIVRRFATTYLNVSPSVIDDSEISLLGKDLLKYYLQVLHLLGFEAIAAKIASASSMNYARKARAPLTSQQLVMSWTHGDAWANRLRPMGITSSPELRYNLAMLQVYMSHITNDKIMKAFLHAMSIYMSYETADLEGVTVQSLWKASTLVALYSNS